MKKLFYQIGEVAEILGENVSLVRFWSNTFEKELKPSRTAGGARQYTAEDVETLKQIHYLVKDKGMSLEGAAKQLRESRSEVSRNVKAIDRLKGIRAQLVEIKKSL